LIAVTNRKYIKGRVIMANKQRGEVGFEADGVRYALLYSVNALCTLEDQLGEGVMKLDRFMSDPENLRFKVLRTIFWAGLSERHPDVTEHDAGNIMTAIGVPRSVALFSKAFALAFPETAGPLEQEPSRPDGIGLHS
jgi:hypothetical protein